MGRGGNAGGGWGAHGGASSQDTRAVVVRCGLIHCDADVFLFMEYPFLLSHASSSMHLVLLYFFYFLSSKIAALFSWEHILVALISVLRSHSFVSVLSSKGKQKHPLRIPLSCILRRRGKDVPFLLTISVSPRGLWEILPPYPRLFHLSFPLLRVTREAPFHAPMPPSYPLSCESPILGVSLSLRPRSGRYRSPAEARGGDGSQDTVREETPGDPRVVCECRRCSSYGGYCVDMK